jgi:hypothetical protein
MPLGKRYACIHTLYFKVEGMAPGFLYINLYPGARTYRLVAYEGGTIKGHAVGTDGKPMKYFVLCTDVIGMDEKEIKRNDNGEFLIEHVPPGVVKLTSYPSGWSNQRDAVAVTVLDGQTTEVTLHREEKRFGSGHVKIKLAEPDGTPFVGEFYFTAMPPLPDSEKYAQQSGGIPISPPGTTDKDGTLTAMLGEGAHDLEIRAEGYVPVTIKGVEVKDKETTELPQAVKLSRGVLLRVKVTGIKQEAPWPSGTRVVVLPMESVIPPLGVEADISHGLYYWQYFDETGTAEIIVPPGMYYLKTLAGYHIASDEIKIEMKPDDKIVSLEIDYSKRSLLALNLVDKDTGEKIKWAAAWFMEPLKPKDHIEFDNSFDRFRTDFNDKEQIVFTLNKSGQEVYLVARGYKPMVYKIPAFPAGKTTEATVQMKQFDKGDLKVKLLPGKILTLNDISEVRVADMNQMGSPDTYHGINEFRFYAGTKTEAQEGVWVAKGLADGACYVNIIAKGGALLATYRSDVEAGKTTEVTFTLPDAGDIEGVLCDVEGNPVPSEIVGLVPDVPASWTLLSSESRWWGQGSLRTDVTTDNDGHFAFHNVSEGKHILLLEHYAGAPEIRVIDVKAGAKNKVEFRLKKPLTLTVNLKLPDGENIPKDTVISLVNLEKNSSGYLDDRAYMAYINGITVEIGGVYPGKYLMQITNGDNHFGPVKQVEITPQTREIEMPVSFKPGNQRISGKIKNLHGQDRLPFYSECVVAISDTYKAEADIDFDGAFKFTAMPPGKYRIIVLSIEQMCLNRDDYIPVKEVKVEEGKNVEGVTIP